MLFIFFKHYLVISAPADGVVKEIKVAQGATVNNKDVLIVLG